MNESLMREFINYSPNKNKAERVYFKCLRNKKYKLAIRISRKYSIVEPSDRVVAFGVALKCRNK